MTGLVTKARTALALGIPNVARAGAYHLGVKLGLNPVRRLLAASPRGPFFVADVSGGAHAPAINGWNGSALLFGRWPFDFDHHAPDWLSNPINGQRVVAPERPWWQIPDFDPAVVDIKLIWELSRFDWTLAFARHARQGDGDALRHLNTWLADWCDHNPPYRGPNWKCGQEASIRVMHLAMAALLLGQVHQPTPGLRELIRIHLQRIAPTIQYAVAQDNNHGTSEAAALFIGGSWLAMLGIDEGKRWERMGRRWLENRTARLIGPEGSFSQYSLNYHRVMLDTLSMAEVWRRHLERPQFSALWNERALAAAQWLRHLVNPLNGDGPNVGANDGARLMQLTKTGYRDHRPSVQLAMTLFAGKRAYDQQGPWNHALDCLGIPLPQQQAPAVGNYLADDGGFAVLRRGAAMVMLRYPRFRFRPSHADALHVDLWLGSENLLRDAGTYSYNTDARWLEYFGGTASHNTVQFDGRDQMPRLSRFLFGDWLKTEWREPLKVNADGAKFGAGYRDTRGASHRRRIELCGGLLRIEDEVHGFADKAVLRWRLAPGAWQVEVASDVLRVANTARTLTLTVTASMPVARCELVEGWESRHYLEKTTVPVLEVEFRQPGSITTEVRWTA
jgi:hypothetical protein